MVDELDKFEADYFHIDCNNDIKVFDDISYIHKRSSTPIDLHIISNSPEDFFGEIRKYCIKQVSFQYENFAQKVNFPNNLGTEIGLAITSNTSVDVFESYKDVCSYVLLMTTTPGQSGGVFDKNTFKRIREFRKKFPNKAIQVDGGVNAEISFILRNLGVDSAVVGSYLFNKPLALALFHLKKQAVGSHYLLKDFMLTLEELPVINEEELTFEKALRSIEDFKMAFTLVVNYEGKLTGLISNAEVRKGLLKNLADLNGIDANQIINYNPLRLEEDKTIYDLLAFIKHTTFPLQYLPVVDCNNKLKGAIIFTQLIKGEL